MTPEEHSRVRKLVKDIKEIIDRRVSSGQEKPSIAPDIERLEEAHE